MGQVDLFEFVRAGLLSNVDVEIVTAVFDMFDYQGKQPEATALRLDLRVVNDESGEIQSQYWTVGGSKDGHHLFVPSEDGQRLEDTGGRTKLALGSNYFALIDSLESCGFDPKKLPNNGAIGGLDGTIGHVIRSKPPEGSYKGTSADDGGEREILLFSEVRKFGYDAKGKKKTAAPKKKAPATTKAAPEEAAEEEASDVDASDIASTLAMEILSEAGELPISRLRIEVFKKTADHDKEVRDAIGAHILDAEWLGEQGFTVEGKKVSI